MRDLLTILFSGFFVLQSSAQQKKIDSLQNLLGNHKANDSIKLNLLNNLAYHYYSVDAEAGLKTSDQAIYLAMSLKLNDKLAKAYINKANNYVALGKDSLALKIFHKVINDKIGEALFGIAKIYQNRAEYETAIVNYKNAYAVFESKDNKINMAKMLNGIGICYMYSSNYPKALETFIEAQHSFERENLTQDLSYANILSNIALIYNRMESKLELAIEYHERALENYRKQDYKIGIANVLSNMANTYDNLNQPKKAIELQQEAYEMYKEIGNKSGMASTLTNIGIAYTSIPDYEKTIYYLKQTLPIYKELGYKTNLAIAECYLGEALLEIPITKSNLIQAENLIKHAIEISKETGDLTLESEAYNVLSKLYVKKGDYKKALEVKDIAVTIHDSLNSQDLKDEITRLEVKYEYDKEATTVKADFEKKQAVSQAEIQRQKLIKNGSIIGGSLLLIITIFGLILYKRKRDAVHQQQEAEFNTKVSDTELKALRAQMNPHFIFNALNSINDFISKNDADSASNYLTKFAKIMRQTLENSTQNEITLDEDMKILNLYLQIEAMRLKNKFTYSIIVDDDVDIENTLIPPLILQPFIENSIWHGISKKETNGHIQIKIKKEADMLVCIVDDNGVGRKTDTSVHNKENTSLGSNITKSRIDIINKKKNTNGTVTMIDKKEGLCVEVKLPLQLTF